MYETTTIIVTAEDGQAVKLIVPTEVPTNEQAAQFDELWKAHVVTLDDHWKGRVEARVPIAIADAVAEAMNFYGAIVDEFSETGGAARLFSRGYWAHGF
ncbi:hypothetical protein LCGC14_1035010 [marine sediment metagenome]|uniref:Uncharacterized protein n=1 Tax=marine sediment metagenome TaxID=412755 RepID=A0A0F9MY33_9ZZZZ